MGFGIAILAALLIVALVLAFVVSHWLLIAVGVLAVAGTWQVRRIGQAQTVGRR